MRFTFVATLIIVISGCGGSSDSGGLPDGFRLISGGGTTVTSDVPANCLNCSISSENNAIDGNASSAAAIYIPSTNASIVSIKAIAQPGLVFPAGSTLAVRFGAPNGITSGTFSLNAYLDGTLVNSYAIQSGVEDQAPFPARYTTAGDTTGPFNEVELSFNKQSSATDAAVDVFTFAVK